jgi:hypothetical protein
MYCEQRAEISFSDDVSESMTKTPHHLPQADDILDSEENKFALDNAFVLIEGRQNPASCLPEDKNNLVHSEGFRVYKSAHLGGQNANR